MRIIPSLDPSAVSEALAVLRAGGVITYPTDTAYGLGADVTRREALECVFAIKGRARNKALSIALADSSDIERYAKVNDFTREMIARLLPGPLTIVLPKRDDALQEMGDGATIGIRLPDHQFSRTLVRNLGHPITATSANRSGETTLYSASLIAKYFAGETKAPDLLIDEGELPHRMTSTVIAIEREGEISILREGAITSQTIALLFPKATIKLPSF